MFSYWSWGPKVLMSIGMITGILGILSSLNIKSNTPMISSIIKVSQKQLDRIRGWYALEINGGPTQYHLTLRPIGRALNFGCLPELRQGDLIKMALTSDSCESQRSRMSGADLHALRVPLQLNQASAEDLAYIKGLGHRRAQDIVRGRPWRTVESLTRLKGIGPKTIRKLSDHLSVTPDHLLWSARYDIDQIYPTK